VTRLNTICVLSEIARRATNPKVRSVLEEAVADLRVLRLKLSENRDLREQNEHLKAELAATKGLAVRGKHPNCMKPFPPRKLKGVRCLAIAGKTSTWPCARNGSEKYGGYCFNHRHLAPGFNKDETASTQQEKK